MLIKVFPVVGTFITLSLVYNESRAHIAAFNKTSKDVTPQTQLSAAQVSRWADEECPQNFWFSLVSGYSHIKEQAKGKSKNCTGQFSAAWNTESPILNEDAHIFQMRLVSSSWEKNVLGCMATKQKFPQNIPQNCSFTNLNLWWENYLPSLKVGLNGSIWASKALLTTWVMIGLLKKIQKSQIQFCICIRIW